MAKPRLISPLLDGFVMGEAVSSHNGIRCCPAIRVEDGRKYIVKIISIPASQKNLDALLLAGAYQSKESALGYFKELTEEIVDNAVLLQRLSRQEGFVSYEGWQVVPMDGGQTGYEVYLLGAYHSTLERYFDKEFMTHLRAVNLGLDLCAALGVCRRNGYLYIDLKPENVAIMDDGEYRICDLGFVGLSSLAYASMPEKYRSSYTAPEIKDAYDSLNSTADTYAAGLILYQAYNNGILPFAGQAPDEPLPPPAYADNEMAQIILKACAPDPKDRWQDPVQMGQALVSYMQRTAVNDVPIAPVPEKQEEEPAEIIADEPSTEQLLAEVDLILDDPTLPSEEAPVEEAPVEEAPVEEVPVEKAPIEEAPVEEAPVQEAPIEEAPIEEAPIEEAPIEEAPIEEAPIEEAPIEEAPIEEAPVEEAPVEEAPIEESPVEEAPIEEAPIEEAPVEKAPVEEDHNVQSDLTAILAQVDALIANELPDPVIVPDPIASIPTAEPEKEPVSCEEPVEDATNAAETLEEPAEEAPVTPLPIIEEQEEIYASAPVRKKRRWKLLLIPVILLLFIMLAVAGYSYYNNYYIQTIQDIKLEGFEDQLTVSVFSDISDEKLTVYCADIYGSTVQAPVKNGVAVFTQLRPGTHYRVYVSIAGKHKLVGVVEDDYITPSTTSVTNLSAITGNEDGSVILNFNVQGEDSTQWTVSYSAENEAEKSVIFTGHMVSITGLTPGSVYTFRVEPVSDLYLVGENTITYTATNIIYAQNLRIESASGGKLVAVWNVPDGVTVESWTVHCYNDADYKTVITVTEPSATFENLDFSTEYTVEVTAEGMIQSVRTYISPNPITIGEVTFDDSNPNKLTVRWDYEGEAPEGGWLILYTVDNNTNAIPVKSNDNSITINPVVPGSLYRFTIQTVAGYTVFNSNCQHQAKEAEVFSGYWLKAEYMKFQMCVPPHSGKWTKADLEKNDYTTSFAAGSKAAFAVTLTEEYNTSPDIIVTLFVIRDTDGNIVLTDNSQSRTWTSMWYKGFGRILIPVLPDTAGQYTMEIYFNGMIVHTQEFSIT